MQATVSTERFGLGRKVRSMAALGLALAFAAGVATGIVGHAVLNAKASPTDASSTAIYQPMPYFGAEPGEGPLLSDFSGPPWVMAHHADGMGEGWVGRGQPRSMQQLRPSDRPPVGPD